MQIYMNAMKECYKTLRRKFSERYGVSDLSLSDFSYFAFHTPFSKMVQKTYLALILADIEINYAEAKQQPAKARYDISLMEELAKNNFKNDTAALNMLYKQFGAQWRDQCERSLVLAKQLGNIYTGSLYNGLLSLICDESIDLTGKNIMMFSYGSGCAASMFVLRVNAGYRRIQQLSDFRPRLARRVRVSAEEYNDWMSWREQNFGKGNLVPRASIQHLDPGTYYLTKIDEQLIRYYALKGEDTKQAKLEGSTSPTLNMDTSSA